MNQWNPKETRAIGESAYLLGGDAKPRGNYYRNKRVTLCVHLNSSSPSIVPEIDESKLYRTRTLCRSGGVVFLMNLSLDLSLR
jgi:hypothetical protein